jgi:hypothetical protein
MTFHAATPEDFAGQSVGSGQCVAYVQRAAAAPLTSQWRRGALVRGGEVPTGTAIATFDANGRYGNHTDGRSHAAIFVEASAAGLLVWDQWGGHPVQQRTIRFQGGSAKPVNDGDAYFVIEADAG